MKITKKMLVLTKFSGEPKFNYAVDGILVEPHRISATDGFRLVSIQVETGLTKPLMVSAEDLAKGAKKLTRKSRATFSGHELHYETPPAGKRPNTEGVISLSAPEGCAFPVDLTIPKDTPQQQMQLSIDTLLDVILPHLNADAVSIQISGPNKFYATSHDGIVNVTSATYQQSPNVDAMQICVNPSLIKPLLLFAKKFGDTVDFSYFGKSKAIRFDVDIVTMVLMPTRDEEYI